MEKLNRSKGAIKGNITKIEGFVQDKSVSKDTTISELEVKLRKIETFQKKTDDLREKYYDVPTINDFPEIDCDLEDMENRLENVEVSLKLLLDSIKNIVPFVNNTNENDNTNVFKPKVNLPMIPLPNFSGKYEEWTNFKTQFTHLIVNNEQLDDSQRLFYLRASLTCDAKKMDSSDDSFESLFTALTERFENKRVLVDSHLHAIINYDKIQHESAKELRSFIDCIKTNLRALKVLEYKQNDLSDVLLINIILQKLDKESRKQFELSLKTTEVPQYGALMTFLENRSSVLESINRTSVFGKQICKMYPSPNKTKTLMINSTDKFKPRICALCKGSHSLNKCTTFQNMDISKRYEIVKENKLCQNCLARNHFVNSCTSKYFCYICSKRHNTLLHRERGDEMYRIDVPNDKKEILSPQPRQTDAQFQTLSNISRGGKKKKSALLSTVYIFIEDRNGRRVRIRCILDNGSNVNCLTNECADILGIKRKLVNTPVTGLNGSVCTIKAMINGTVSNANESFREKLDFFLVPKITDMIPATCLDISEISLPKFIELADPTYFKPGKIQALVGAELFFKILRRNYFKVNDELFMQDSVFGWIATGTLTEVRPVNKERCCLIIDEAMDDNLKQFWELESLGIKHDDPKLTEEDQAMKIFNRTTTFENGRYQVQLPWKRDCNELSDNFTVAKQRFKGLQRKLRQNPELFFQYSEILKDYLQQGIIERVEEIDSTIAVDKTIYYLPHQAVCKQERLTTKTRIVFDASSHDSGQLSLNDCLWQGPNLNPNLLDILIGFRLNKIAISADIEKAFLQISLAEKDRDAVRFLWVDESNEDETSLQIYRFKRVLFGVNASPFLLSATIKKHVEQFSDEYPIATRLLGNCLYVDDFITGADNLQDALEVSRNAKDIMIKAGMVLRKWITNENCLKERWKEEGFDFHQPQRSISLGSNLTKVLGMAWNTVEDCLTMEIQSLLEFLSSKKNTKRFLLQAVGKIFDPLGMLTPFTIRVKCLFQELWLRKVPWDGDLPSDIQEEWLQWCKELPQLTKLKIPRNVLDSTNEECGDVVEIHSFCDASKKAYGVAIYIRVIKEDGIKVNLVASKSRVAPLKKITLPRLELLGALLAARLTNKIKRNLDVKKPSTVYYWTDSKIALYWIKGSVKRWKLFVANRVKEIQTLTDQNSWYHCPGKYNSADLVTRGISADSLLDNSMWWKGPSFLTSPDLPYLNGDVSVPEEDIIPEMKRCVEDSEHYCDSNLTLALSSAPDLLDCLLKISNDYLKILYVLAYIFRFAHNCKSTQKRVGPLKHEDFKQAESFLLKKAQHIEFQEDITGLTKYSNVLPSSRLKTLSPFLDENGLIRVGGRLNNSSLNYDSKHPVLLPPKSKLTYLILQYYHEKYLHSGPQTLLYQIRQKYWPLNGRNLCRKLVHNCIQCFKANPKICSQKMGDLPKERINQDFVFNSVGIDLCGPFLIKNKNQRKGSLVKIYVCLFICLVTKAIHLEIVSDLTSESLIATLKRFVARRGKCAKIFSDNATNFVGANKELREFQKLVSKQDESLARFSSEENIEWKFIPPRAPNFGGLWEAGVKSFKYYLKRVVGSSHLTYEEFLTIMVQVEAMLNSRPLTPLSSEIDDLEIITPAHFLIGRTFTSIVEPSLTHIETNKLNLWQKTTKAAQTIWKKWSNSYLNNLQQRTKWMFDKQNVKIGELVLVKEDNLPACTWNLGRIIKIYPGKDDIIRVVDIKTKAGVFKRAVSKLCVLPIEI